MQLVQTIRRSLLKRHFHAEPYAALVLSGSYEEAGDNGRLDVSAGNAVFHDACEEHLNRFPKHGAIVLNLRLPPGNCYAPGVATVRDPDRVARVAERSRRAAVDLLLSTAVTKTPLVSDWPDELAAALTRCPSLKLSEFGDENGLAPWTVSRGFAQVFGISPEAFRARIRTRRALQLIKNGTMSLAFIAADLGFADQAHMTRSVKQMTGFAPRVWRFRANGFKTGALRTV